MTEQQPKYLQFPLFLIRDAFESRESVFSKILSYGIFRYSTSFKYSLDDVARQVIYNVYNDKLELALKKHVKSLNSDIIGYNQDYRGFDADGQFEPTDEISELLIAFEANNSFKILAIEHYQMHLAFSSLLIKGNIDSTLKIGKEIQNQIPENEPMPMLNKSLIFDYRDNVKSEFDIALLLAYMAIRSILGKKQYARTNKQHIVARMFGYSSHKTIPNELKPHIKELICKYSKRYHIDKLLTQLELSWHITTYSHHMRGLYVGNGVSLDMMALIGESRKRNVKITKLKNDKNLARNKALKQIQQHLNKGEQLNKEGG